MPIDNPAENLRRPKAEGLGPRRREEELRFEAKAQSAATLHARRRFARGLRSVAEAFSWTR